MRTKRARRRTCAVTFAVAVAAVPAVSQACSTCGCGDYTITLMGVEKPFPGRLRTALDFTVRSESFGADPDRQVIDEDRTTLGLSYSPFADLTLALQVPYVHKRNAEPGAAPVEGRGLGDADLAARVVLYRDNPAFAHHLAGLRVALRLPTSEQVRDQTGALLDIDSQPDAGALTPSLGLWYGYYRLPVLVSFSSAYLFYGHGRQQFDPGDALVGTLTAQYGIVEWFAAQLSLDARHTGPNRFSGVEDPDSGGTLVALTPGTALRFGPDFVVNASVQVPVVKRLNGSQDEATGWRLGLAYDF